jgi:hypothetical protein
MQNIQMKLPFQAYPYIRFMQILPLFMMPVLLFGQSKTVGELGIKIPNSLSYNSTNPFPISQVLKTALISFLVLFFVRNSLAQNFSHETRNTELKFGNFSIPAGYVVIQETPDADHKPHINYYYHWDPASETAMLYTLAYQAKDQFAWANISRIERSKMPPVKAAQLSFSVLMEDNNPEMSQIHIKLPQNLVFETATAFGGDSGLLWIQADGILYGGFKKANAEWLANELNQRLLK